MKVLTISYSDNLGGAARAAYRIHKGLNKREHVSSIMMVQRKFSKNSTVQTVGGTSKAGYLYNQLRPVVDGLVNKLQRSSNTIVHNSNWLPSGLHRKINRSDADIVHLHWVGGGMISVKEISKIKKPIIWTLHDMWMFCGAEHYDDLNSPKRYIEGYKHNNRPSDYKGLDIDRWTWRRKVKYWTEKEFNIVTPSNWLADCARESYICEDKNIQVIPYGLDLNIYKPISKNIARQILNLPEGNEQKYILFGAMSSTSDIRKGYKQLMKALGLLKDKEYKLLVFGSEENKELNFGLPTNYLGILSDDVTLALAYSAADVMIVPSLQDNLPNTALESVACGTPVVAYDVGGLPDIVDHKVNGYLAKTYNPEDLARGIEWVLESQNRNIKLGKQARDKAKQNYSLANAAKQYEELYEMVLNK